MFGCKPSTVVSSKSLKRLGRARATGPVGTEPGVPHRLRVPDLEASTRARGGDEIGSTWPDLQQVQHQPGPQASPELRERGQGFRQYQAGAAGLIQIQCGPLASLVKIDHHSF